MVLFSDSLLEAFLEAVSQTRDTYTTQSHRTHFVKVRTATAGGLGEKGRVLWVLYS